MTDSLWAQPGTTPVSSGLEARKLAEGVLTVVDPDQNADDTSIGPFDLDFVNENPDLEWAAPAFPAGQPNFASRSETLLEMGRDVTLRHPVWGLEFAFKPMRLIEAPVPVSGGQSETKVAWYLVYRVTYVGGDLMPDVESDAAGTGVPRAPKSVVFPSVRFLPRFILTDTQTKKEYESKILSSVIPAIASRERVGKPLLDTFQMSRVAIQPSLGDENKSHWGVATWTDVDPKTDYFTVHVKGLTNAYRIRYDSAGKKLIERKTLQLHFWRPGDTIAQTQDRILLGVPAFSDPLDQRRVLEQFGLQERLDYQWIYR